MLAQRNLLVGWTRITKHATVDVEGREPANFHNYPNSLQCFHNVISTRKPISSHSFKDKENTSSHNSFQQHILHRSSQSQFLMTPLVLPSVAGRSEFFHLFLFAVRDISTTFHKTIHSVGGKYYLHIRTFKMSSLPYIKSYRCHLQNTISKASAGAKLCQLDSASNVLCKGIHKLLNIVAPVIRRQLQ